MVHQFFYCWKDFWRQQKRQISNRSLRYQTPNGMITVVKVLNRISYFIPWKTVIPNSWANKSLVGEEYNIQYDNYIFGIRDNLFYSTSSFATSCILRKQTFYILLKWLWYVNASTWNVFSSTHHYFESTQLPCKSAFNHQAQHKYINIPLLM